jgi:rSAM/selenodomain-associated transferase 1
VRLADARILIFARTPRVGEVKTRLIPLLGAQGAYAFHFACLRSTLQRLGSGGSLPLQLWLDKESDDPELLALAARQGCEIHIQQGGDLGQRMAHAAHRALAGAAWVVLVGTDVPLLDADYVRQALQRLEQGADAVMGPADDGGYVLLGMRRLYAELFEGMPWGGDSVAQLTRERCAGLGLDLSELPALWDLDRPEDLRRLCGLQDDAMRELQALACQHLPRL